MKILLFGPRGYLGQQFKALYPDVTASEADVTDSKAAGAELDRVRPDIVINAAGKTGTPNVDWCEDHKEETLRGNVTGPLVLLDECGKRGIYWVQLSSGCVYEGKRGNISNRGNRGSGAEGFTEEDPPNFFGSFYARSKAWSEQMLREVCDSVGGRGGILILRLRMPFDGSSSPRNLIMKLRKYAKVLDVENSLTFMPEFLSAAKVLIERRRTGIWNIVNPGIISPFTIMQMYQEIVDPAHRFERITLKDLPTVVKAGRSNCILSTKKLEGEGISLRPVEEAMSGALQELKKFR